MNYFFHPQARVEHLQYVAYYESQRQGLGARYLSTFDAAMSRVCEAPRRYKLAFPPNIRLIRIPGFPYSILYREVALDVEVLVIAPHRRRPDYWIDRI